MWTHKFTTKPTYQEVKTYLSKSICTSDSTLRFWCPVDWEQKKWWLTNKSHLYFRTWLSYNCVPTRSFSPFLPPSLDLSPLSLSSLSLTLSWSLLISNVLPSEEGSSGLVVVSWADRHSCCWGRRRMNETWVCEASQKHDFKILFGKLF